MGINLSFNLIFFFAILYILFKFISFNLKRPKNLPPGPKALPLIGHLHLLKRPLHITLHKLPKTYGPVMYLQFGFRKVVVVSSPKAAEECFTKNDIIFADRPQTIAGKLLTYNRSTIGFASYGNHWRNLRRITTIEIFCQNRLAMFSNIRQEEVHFFLKELYEESYSYDFKHIKVALRSKFSGLALNIIMRIIAGKRYHTKLSRDRRKFEEMIKEMVEFHGIVHLEDYLPIFQWFDYKGLKKRVVILMKKMDCLLQNLIDDHRSLCRNKETNKTLIDTLLSMQDTDPELFPDQTIKTTILSLLGAGTETTTNTLEWAMSLLVSHPEAMKRTLTEIEKCVGKDRLLDENDIPKLNYLNNVITETLRLYPPAPLLLPHNSVEDCNLCGYEVPKGTMLLTNAWTIQRDPKLWDEPNKFKPERFNGIEGEGYKLIPFGAGRRACPGANLGRRVITLTLGALIQSFEWERIGEEEIDMTESSGLSTPKAKPLEVLCRPRKSGVTAVLSSLPKSE